MALEVHNPDNLPLVSISHLLETQGNLKDLSESNYQKLKKSIVKHGFISPITVWWSGDSYYIIDGHQRKRVLGIEWPEAKVPVTQIPAKSLQEASEILLKIASQYGTVTQEGIDEYIATYELPEIELLDEINFDAIYSPIDVPETSNNREVNAEDLLDESKTVCCPRCKFEFEP